MTVPFAAFTATLFRFQPSKSFGLLCGFCVIIITQLQCLVGCCWIRCDIAVDRLISIPMKPVVGGAVQQASQLVRDLTVCDRVYAIAFGEGAQHLHLHLIPRFVADPQTTAWCVADFYRAVAHGDASAAHPMPSLSLFSVPVSIRALSNCSASVDRSHMLIASATGSIGLRVTNRYGKNKGSRFDAHHSGDLDWHSNQCRC